MQRTMGFFALSLLSVSVAYGATETAAAAAAGLTSEKEHGTVSIVSAPSLVDGQLVIKVVGYNRSPEASPFGPENVKITTAAGKPVPLATLDQLVARIRGSQSTRRPAHTPSTYSSPSMGSDSAGRPDVSGYTGGSQPLGGGLDTHTSDAAAAPRAPDSPAVKAQIEALHAALLQSQTLPAAGAGGGQVVTSRLKFGRKEARALRMTVDLNGEQHEFTFVVPAD